ncbi:MAG: GH3 auxin-responsive promoter family protein [Thaumarchaeota archaeon]|nr:GH3 auxin-responsive promoter family protein [Nitrososphaerota archaeon]
MSASDLELLQLVVKPWYDSLSDPAEAQKEALKKLLETYSKTDYGKTRGATTSLTTEEYRQRFPPVNYSAMKPLIQRVSKGEYAALLPEPPAAWVSTRGTTGESKIIPVTNEHLSQILFCGARAIVNHVLKKGDLSSLQAKVLNLNFPSTVGTIQNGDKSSTYGYSSGTYAKLLQSFAGATLVPKQEDIDALGSGITKADWEARFDLTYRLTKDEDVRVCMGVAPVLLAFARYVAHRYGKPPKQFWRIESIFCTSVPKIQWKYAPILRQFFGAADVREMYSATEGVFAQQIDDLPYVSPNYDTYVFEAVTRNGTKMLHELKRGEWGRLLVSSCLFPRYNIGDLIECMGRQYFRVFGRARLRTLVEHHLHRALTRWFV